MGGGVDQQHELYLEKIECRPKCVPVSKSEPGAAWMPWLLPTHVRERVFLLVLGV